MWKNPYDIYLIRNFVLYLLNRLISISQLGNFFFPIGEIKSASQAGIRAFNKYSDNLQVAKNIGNDILADVTIFH